MTWKKPKSQLRLTRKKEKVSQEFLRGLLRYGIAAAVLIAAVLTLPALWDVVWPLFRPDPPARPQVVINPAPSPTDAEEQPLNKESLAKIIGPHSFRPDEVSTFDIRDEAGHSLFVRTTMDPVLQDWAVRFIPKCQALSAALVALDPATGDVLAMASHRADGQPINVALSSSFPAASLFKIVTAAAAVEQEKLSSGSTLAYDGGKHTLYKKNLKGGISEGRNQVTLKDGFADSINTVFGKLGAFSLGPEALEDFARRFHFNQPINFEMPVQESEFDAPDDKDPYRLAELASGFNRMTTVSPLHGAMLASAVVNGGRLMEPSVVREVFDQDNRIYYTHEPRDLGRAVSERTVAELRKMMRATITEGTGRRRFGDAARHKVLKQLEIGGKSGTINNDQGNKVDWFVSFAAKGRSGPSLALAVVVVHGEKLGIRSQEIVRQAIITYFQPRTPGAG